MVGEVIFLILHTDLPVNLLLSLYNPIIDTMRLHVHCFGLALFFSVVYDAYGTVIFDLNNCGLLRMSHII